MRLNIEHCGQVAEKGGGMCMSDTYVNKTSKLLWMCSDSHTWESNLCNIKNGNWCLTCSGPRSEEMCRDIFGTFGYNMLKCRPDFLDGYDETMGLAFEYQGIKHYEYIRHFHQTFEKT